MLDLEVSSPKKPAQHLETISFVVRHQKSYTFHTFPSRLQIFPPDRLTRQTSFLYVRKSKPPFLPTEPYRPQEKATALGNQSQNYRWLPWQQNKLSGRPRRRRGVIYPRMLVRVYYTTMPLRAYQNISGWYSGIPNDEPVMYALTHWPVCKHNKNTLVTGKSGGRTTPSDRCCLCSMVSAAK